MSCLLQKSTLLCWRLYQTLLLTVIFSLEFARLQEYGRDDDGLSGGHNYYMLLTFVTYVLLLYYLARFSYRWITGPHKSEIFVDIILALLWLVASLINTIYGTPIACKNHDSSNDTSRCNLYVSSVTLSWIYTTSYGFCSYILITRWRNRPTDAKPVDPSSIESQKPETYVVQKGVLADGQPALFFHMAQKNVNLSKGGTSGNVSPKSTQSSSSDNQANISKTNVYLHGKNVNDA